MQVSASSGLEPFSFSVDGPCNRFYNGPSSLILRFYQDGQCTVTAGQGGDIQRNYAVATQVYATAKAAPKPRADLRTRTTRLPALGLASGVAPTGVTVSVTNDGPADSGPVATTVLTNLTVTDAQGASTSSGALGSTQLSYTSKNIPAGTTVEYTLTTQPDPGLAVLGAYTRDTTSDTADPNPFNNFTVAAYPPS